MVVIKIDMGRVVICDFCNEDYTFSELSGGILFGSYATCPKCEVEIRKDAARYGELDRIKDECPSDMSFADWVRTKLRS